MSKQEQETKVPSLETGYGCFEIQNDFGVHKYFNPAKMISAFMQITGGCVMQQIWGAQLGSTTEDSYPVITSIKNLSPDVVEIRRKIIHKRFFNKEDQEEVIVVNRKAAGQENGILMETRLTEPGIKTEASKLTGAGYLVKRCLVSQELRESPTFRSVPQSIKMLSDVFMYKNLRTFSQISVQFDGLATRHGYLTKQGKELTGLKMTDLMEII